MFQIFFFILFFCSELHENFNEKFIKTKTFDHILRFVSRIEALVHDNTAMTLSDSSNLFNCRMESCDLNQGDENEYIVVWDYKCQHLGNTG